MAPPDPARQDLPGTLLKRDQWVVLACLVAASAIAWWWLIDMQVPVADGGMAGMAGMDMTGMDMGGMEMSAMAPAKPRFAPTFLMWLVMMVAMMLPSAAPMILLYGRFAESARSAGGALMPTALFATLYLVVWAAFSLLASAVQLLLSATGWVDLASMAIGSRPIAGGLLIAAALYQLTPAKRACLDNCRSPLGFLRREWGPGWGNAVRLGLKHGAYCVGCCWLLMSLLFVGGVMNLAWVAVLALIVLVEKVAPMPQVSRWLIAIAAFTGGGYLLLGLV